MKRLHISLLALTAALPQATLAQDIALDEIVVTATFEDAPASRIGSTVTLVDEAALQSAGDTRLVDFLNRLPGVSVTATGGLGSTANVSLRGASQNYIAVFVDGIDVSDPTGPQVAYDFGQLTTAGISRIEVLKGSQSALYGSGAVGGVISITSRKATEPGTHHYLEAEGGSFGTGLLTYALTRKTDTIEAAVTASRVATKGFSAADEADGNTEADGYEANKLSFNLAVTLDSGARIGVSGFTSRAISDYDAQFYVDPAAGPRLTFADQIDLGDGFSPDEMQTTLTSGLRTFAEFTTGAVDHTVSASTFRVARRYQQSEQGLDFADYDPVTDTYGSTLSASDNTYTGNRVTLDYQAGLDLGAGRLVFGGDYARETYDQTGTYGELSAATSVTGAFAELSQPLGAKTDLSLALRHDTHSLFGGFTTARLSLTHRATDSLTFRAQTGTGYRAPSNFELFSFYGAPDLQPEESVNVDLGVEKSFGDNGLVRATAFYLEVENLIDYDFSGTGCEAFVVFGSPGCYNQVPGTSRRSGIELEGEFALTGFLQVAAAYTYTDSATNASSAWGEIARHQLALNLTADLAANLSGSVTVAHAADRPTLPDYTVVNASVTYDLSDRSEAYVRIENLFDEQYQLVPGYGTSDRAVYVGVRAEF